MREKSRRVRRLKERGFVLLFFLGVGIALFALGALFFFIIQKGLPRLSINLFLYPATYNPANLDMAGISVALVSSLFLVGLTMLFSLPLSIGAAIYLEEYGKRSRVAQYFQTAVTNLAGVPSVVFGLLGLGLFVQIANWGASLIAGALTLTLLVFPYIVTATQEALRAVPQSTRDASLAMGATKWQTIRKHVLPAASPGVMTGAILASSRAIGETAPILVIGAAALQDFIPDGLFSPFTALPVQIFFWAGHPREEFQELAAAAIIVFLGILLLMNLAAILLRQRWQRRA